MKMHLLKNLYPRSSQRATAPVRIRRLRITLLTAVIVALVISFASSRFAQERPTASSNQPVPSDGAATWSILNPQAAHAQRPKNRQFLEEEAVAHFTILNPDVANRERRKDLKEAEKEALAQITILKAKELEAEFSEDPEMRRKKEEAFRSLNLR